ncbi:hypothetical protein, partial [Cronobacter sakazakii]
MDQKGQQPAAQRAACACVKGRQNHQPDADAALSRRAERT